MESAHQIRELLDRVRRRWRRLLIFRAASRVGLALAIIAIALVLPASLASSQPMVLVALAAAGIVLLAAACSWGVWRVGRKPTDLQVARFIEEGDPTLDDRLASAVDLLGSRRQQELPGLAGPMIADAARRASAVAPASILSGETLRRAGFQAAAALLLLAAVVVLSRDTVRRSYDALAVTIVPSRVTLDVKPGNLRVPPGSTLTIEARLAGNRAPVVARVLRGDAAGDGEDEEAWRASDMSVDASGTFRLPIDPVGASFKYRVAAGTATSPIYEVTVVRAPRVTRIDAEFVYPPSFGLKPRLEEDGGDIYAPAGTEVRLELHTDREASTGQIDLGDGQLVPLSADGTILSGSLKVVRDGSYRVAIADREGIKNPGDTEYFIRTLEDRPPDVKILRPASDRTVTRLEEVDIEAQAEDDFGIDRFELVYAVRGGAEKVVPLRVPRQSASMTDSATIYLEDLNVQPGDFVSYYVRARDLARGKRASEARSDIFFLEVKPFEQEFELAQSQAMGGGGGNRQIDDLVVAQKEIIVATWKLDRRAQAANGARPEADIRSVAKAESELKTRVEEAASSFRTSMMRDPRGRTPVPGRGRGAAPQPDSLRAGQTMSEEDAMTAAAMAMGKAVGALNDLKTAAALPTEMEALNHLLKAQGDVKKRQVSRQQAGSGAGSNRAGQDMSSLFDRELQRQQQTNYETPNSAETKQEANASFLDKIKDLARRQDELLKRQRDVAKGREGLSPEELKRQLERLTREQSDLRQRADELAQQMGQQNAQAGQQNAQAAQRGQSGDQSQARQQGRGSQSPQSGRGSGSGQEQSARNTPGSPESGSGSRNGQQMREASEEMRNAAGDLRRQDPAQASQRGERALQRLREIERQLQSASAPDEDRRARGDLQLEARQLADSQRELESEFNRSAQGEAGKDSLRRLAGEQDRLAERARALQQGLGRQASSPDGQGPGERDSQQAVVQTSREFGEQRVGDRMRQSAEQMRTEAGRSSSSPNASPERRATAAAQRDIARALDKLADRLAAAESGRDDETRKLSDQLGRAQQLRERIDELTSEVERLGEAGGEPARQSSAAQAKDGKPGQDGAQGDGGAAADQLRAEYNRKLQETRELLEQLRRDDNTLTRGGPGFTFEGQGMVLSAPGTESFKQDFAKWEALRKQATQALEQAESSLSKRLQAKAARDWLAAGVDDKAPAGYQQQVDSYFKALASKPKP